MTEAGVKAWYKNKSVLLSAGVGLLVIAIGSGSFFLLRSQTAQNISANPLQEQQQIVARVGALMELPQNEQPTIATVTDISKLQAQAFFQHAKNGDKVLIYKQTKEAILYDPDTNKIVQVSSVNTGASNPAPSVVPTAQAVNVALFNGTTVSGLTKTIEAQLKSKAPNVTVITKANASKSTYTKTLVIDLSGKHQAESVQLAAVLNGIVGSLPAGETKPAGVDLMVILGKQ